MKSFINTTRLIVVFLFIFMLLFDSYGCKTNYPSETTPADSSETSGESHTDITDAEKENEEENLEDEDAVEEITEDEIENEIFATLNNFLQSVKENKEYGFFDSYTREMVGSEEEYLNGLKSDLYYIIKESHSAWKKLEFKDLLLVDDRAIITVTGDRSAEGTEYIDEEVKFKFIKEDGTWKIDAYYPLDIFVTPLSPEPESALSSSEIDILEISIKIKSFFAINSINLELNDFEKSLAPGEENPYEPEISTDVPKNYLSDGLNEIHISINTIAQTTEDFSWKFTLE